jgi:hypothetical protein
VITNIFWLLLARIATIPAVTEWLIKQSFKTPYDHLPGYMNRWWLIPRRWKLPYVVRIHHILRRDLDPFPHDHPGDWRTIILKGQYCEQDVFGSIHLREVGDTVARQATDFHNIIQVSDGGVWTLFLMRKTHNQWGFMVTNDDGVPVKLHWEHYISQNGRVDPSRAEFLRSVKS